MGAGVAYRSGDAADEQAVGEYDLGSRNNEYAACGHAGGRIGDRAIAHAQVTENPEGALELRSKHGTALVCVHTDVCDSKG